MQGRGNFFVLKSFYCVFHPAKVWPSSHPKA